MNSGQRIMLAVGIVLADLVMIALPVTAIFAAYVIMARPLWFKEWVGRLYSD